MHIINILNKALFGTTKVDREVQGIKYESTFLFNQPISLGWSTQWIFGTQRQFHLLLRLHFVDGNRSEQCATEEPRGDPLRVVLELGDQSPGNAGLFGENPGNEHVF